MDTLFCEMLVFHLPKALYAPCLVAMSREESLRQALAAVGLELIDYGSFTALSWAPPVDLVHIEVFSKAYRERIEREALAR